MMKYKVYWLSTTQRSWERPWSTGIVDSLVYLHGHDTRSGRPFAQCDVDGSMDARIGVVLKRTTFNIRCDSE
jgi:hypothetical protein